MKIEIEKYKGFEIRFDTEKETFECDIDDSRSVKKSYSAIKKFITDWIKDNEVFKPFKIQGIPDSYASKEIKTIIGKHGNGNLIYKDKYDKIQQLSVYDFKNYMLVNKENDQFYILLDQIQSERDVINKRQKELESKFIVKTVKDYLSEQSL
jgi:hypothetical protein